MVGMVLTMDYNNNHVSILLLWKSHNYRQAIKQELHFYIIIANTRQSLDRRRTTHHPKNEAISTFLYDQNPLGKKTNCMTLLISDNGSTIHFTRVFTTDQICITLNLHFKSQIIFLHSSELSESKPSNFLLSFAFNFFMISSSVINSPSLKLVTLFLIIRQNRASSLRIINLSQFSTSGKILSRLSLGFFTRGDMIVIKSLLTGI